MTYSEIFNRAWNDMKHNLAFVAGLTLVMMMGTWCLSLIPVFGIFFSALLSVGYFNCLYRLKKGQEIGYADFFWGFTDMNRLLQVVIMSLIVNMGMIVGFICLIVPGIWWMIASWFSNVIFVTKEQDAVAAIKGSMRIVKDRWWFFAGFGCLFCLLLLGGVMCFLVGVLIALPVSSYAMIEIVEYYYSPAPGFPVQGGAQSEIGATAAEPPPIA